MTFKFLKLCSYNFHLLLLLLLLLLTAIELLHDGSSPYTSTDKTYKNKYTIYETIQKTQYKQYKKTVNTNIHITKTPTHYTQPHTQNTHPHIDLYIKRFNILCARAHTHTHTRTHASTMCLCV